MISNLVVMLRMGDRIKKEKKREIMQEKEI
jgi:hypothetical protein